MTDITVPTRADILCLADSVKQSTVTASLMLQELGSYPRQSGLAMALRELGRIEHTVHPLLAPKRGRPSTGAGRTEQGGGPHCPGPGGVFQPLAELRDRGFEQQRYRVSGLNLVTAAVVLWGTVYLE